MFLTIFNTEVEKGGIEEWISHGYYVETFPTLYNMVEGYAKNYEGFKAFLEILDSLQSFFKEHGLNQNSNDPIREKMTIVENTIQSRAFERFEELVEGSKQFYYNKDEEGEDLEQMNLSLEDDAKEVAEEYRLRLINELKGLDRQYNSIKTIVFQDFDTILEGVGSSYTNPKPPVSEIDQRKDNVLNSTMERNQRVMRV